MLKAVIMDFDGVIIDTEVVWHEVFVAWFKKHKKYDLTMDEFLKCVGANSEELLRYLEAERSLSIDRDFFEEETKSLFMEKVNALPPKEGIVDFVKKVRNEGLKLALATSSFRERPFKYLTKFGIIHFFDALITADDVERIKPHPDLFLKALKELDVEAKETVIVEDSLNGLIAGKSAGAEVIVVPNAVTKHSEFAGYYRMVDSLKNVSVNSLIEEFNSSCKARGA
ncbi:MAG: HAD family phosphatase [Clostridia bacterium]|nr:HAD family phosphatase [Clostridia bacterium]